MKFYQKLSFSQPTSHLKTVVNKAITQLSTRATLAFTQTRNSLSLRLVKKEPAVSLIDAALSVASQPSERKRPILSLFDNTRSRIQAQHLTHTPFLLFARTSAYQRLHQNFSTERHVIDAEVIAEYPAVMTANRALTKVLSSEEKLLVACEQGQLESVKNLLHTCQDIDLANTQALLIAVQHNQRPVIDYLLDQHIGLEARDKAGNTVLHRAAAFNRASLIDKLDMLALEATNNLGETALHTAIRLNAYEAFSVLLKQSSALLTYQATLALSGNNTVTVTPLQLAVMEGRLEMVDKLLTVFREREWQMQVQGVVRGIGTLLHLAIFSDQPVMLRHLLVKIAVRDKLLDVPNDQGQSPTSFAAYLGRLEALEILCQQGSSLKTDRSGLTPLHWAVEARQIMAIRKLIAYKSDIDTLDNKHRESPRELARRLARLQESSKKAHLYKAIENLLTNRKERENLQHHTPMDFAQMPPVNLVFQGGGPKVISSVGALNALVEQLAKPEKTIPLESIKRVAGTSAGAITATLLAFDYSLSEIQNLLNETDLNQFLDHEQAGPVLDIASIAKNPTLINALSKFLQACMGYFATPDGLPTSTPIALFKELYYTQGLCPGERFRQWIENLIYAKTGQRNLTFGELHQLIQQGKPYKALYVVATNLEKLKIEVINSEESQWGNLRWQDIIIADAVRCTMSIPGLFKPHYLYMKNSAGERTLWSNDAFVDGGLIYNYPIDIFDKFKYQQHDLLEAQRDYPVFNRETLGFSLVPPPEDVEAVPTRQVNNVFSLVKQVGKVYFYAEKLLAKQRGTDPMRTVYINNQGIGLLDFNLTIEQKQALINAGYDAVAQFYARFKRDWQEQTSHTANSTKEESFKATLTNVPAKKDSDFFGLSTLIGAGAMALALFYFLFQQQNTQKDKAEEQQRKQQIADREEKLRRQEAEAKTKFQDKELVNNYLKESPPAEELEESIEKSKIKDVIDMEHKETVGKKQEIKNPYNTESKLSAADKALILPQDQPETNNTSQEPSDRIKALKQAAKDIIWWLVERENNKKYGSNQPQIDEKVSNLFAECRNIPDYENRVLELFDIVKLPSGNNKLHMAAYIGNPTLLELVLSDVCKEGVLRGTCKELNEGNPCNSQPLHYAVGNVRGYAFYNQRNDDPQKRQKIIELLICSGAELNKLAHLDRNLDLTPAQAAKYHINRKELNLNEESLAMLEGKKEPNCQEIMKPLRGRAYRL